MRKLFLAWFLFTSGVAAAQTSTQLAITGEVKAQLTLSAADLRAFPPVQQASFAQARGMSATWRSWS